MLLAVKTYNMGEHMHVVTVHKLSVCLYTGAVGKQGKRE